MRGERVSIFGIVAIMIVFGAVAVFLDSGRHGAQAVMAQAPTIGATNTAAAQTAAAGVTAISATDTPPTPTVPPTPTPLPPSPLAPRAIGTGAPPGGGVGSAPTIPPSSGSVTSRSTPAVATNASGTSGGSAWPAVGIVVAIAALGAAVFFLARNARGKSPTK